nr:MAG: hypothetical protein [Bacteriophage sp.]
MIPIRYDPIVSDFSCCLICEVAAIDTKINANNVNNFFMIVFIFVGGCPPG